MVPRAELCQTLWSPSWWLSPKPAQLDWASLLKPCSVPEPLRTKCLFIQHILNVVKSSFPSLMDGNGLNNASGTYCRNWWFLLLCIPGVSLFPCAAQIPLLDPTRWQEGKPKKQKWVIGVDWECGSLLFCLHRSALNTQTTARVNLPAQDLNLSVSQCSLVTDFSWFLAFVCSEKAFSLQALIVPLPYPRQSKYNNVGFLEGISIALRNYSSQAPYTSNFLLELWFS